MMKKILIGFGIIILLLVVVSGTLYLIYLRPFMEKMKVTEVVQYDKDLTIVLGGGGNSGILNSDSLVLVIDTKMDAAAEDLYKKVKQIAGNKPIFVVNTHAHSDHSKGNKNYQGQTILAGGNYTKEQWIKQAGEAGMPTIWLKDRMDLPMGDDTATIINLQKHTHTESDVMVYLHRRKMLFGGDVILNKQAPVLIGRANPEAYMEAIDMLPKLFDIQKIVPGHGPMGGIEILDNFKQYFNDMKLAAADDSKKEDLIAKYKDWNQIPIIMSPAATVSAFKKMNDK
jgi:glyoxylase-like metal-dependent hydrolase (beta-lactamase superfamily II)